MHLTRKQLILIVTLGCVAILLIIGLVFLMQCAGKRDPIPTEPSPPPIDDSPAATDSPEPTPSPSPEPSLVPTPYRLPLVPEGAASPTPQPLPSSPPSPGPSNTPQAERPNDVRDGVYTEQIKEFMAIGTQNGEAIAVLLVRVEPPNGSIVAIPCETQTTVYTLSEDASVDRTDVAPLSTATVRAPGRREGCWNLVWAVKNLTGWRAPEYLYVDFACMEAFFSFIPSIPTEDGDVDLAAFSAILNSEGEPRARALGALGAGLVRVLGRVSIWDLPSFKAATRDAFCSSLSVFDLLALMRDLKKVDSFSVTVLPTEQKNGVLVRSDAAGLPF